ncbi:MAG: hypothetical protein IIW97_06990, partial [Alistipes sp.]|nr:hypothetical protein [Alistipes sp.]
MKQIFKTIAIIIALCVLAVACVEDNEFILPEDPNTEKPEGGNEDNKENGEDDGKEDGKDDGGKDEPTPEPPIYNDYPDTAWAAGELDWVFDMNVLPEIRISVTEEQWNELLKEYDRDSNTAEYVHCDAEFKSKGETHNFVDAGLRLRGNTSRRRPEGNGGEMHKRDNADWHHCHFMLNLRKYQKDDAHELHNVRKLHLKWHKDDRAYCRELYCYDLFRR